MFKLRNLGFGYNFFYLQKCTRYLYAFTLHKNVLVHYRAIIFQVLIKIIVKCFLNQLFRL